MSSFPDQSHIEQIRKRLWSGREVGQAAVMVGAGFSRNANRVSPSVPLFPLWNDVAGQFFDALYPPGRLNDADRQAARLRMTSGNGPLKLALEYEEEFGRPNLDALLLQAIPDDRYVPGQLHEILLSLPWSDIFTTNYDTLLERARTAVHDRRYDLILGAPDITGGMKPRIVKLHGSFPSHRPFVITEEDYRKYPREFAPFVNMVQQAIMENILCLIGFSGDDPNFLYWSGWVRDNLGNATPPIYLCGLLNLSSSQRKVLEKRKIVPIDLSPLFPTSRWYDPQIRFRKAYEWFLLTLANGEPPNVMNWPVAKRVTRWRPSGELPDLLPAMSPLPDPGSDVPAKQALDEVELKQLCEVWRQTREHYPGWVVAPKENRDELWRYTEHWISPILSSVGSLAPPLNLSLLFELNWRLETAMLPIIINQEQVPIILSSFNPFPSLVTIQGSTIDPSSDEWRTLPWDEIAEWWISLIFSLVRNARLLQDEARFRALMDLLRSVAEHRPEWLARWFYEKCLFDLCQFDQEMVRASLRSWPEVADLPFWEVKRASLMAEIGELDEAEKLAEQCLSRIRSRIQPYSVDYSTLSQEGWTMVLLKIIKNSRRSTETDFRYLYRDRWEKLEEYRCNPTRDIESLRLRVNGPAPVVEEPKTVRSAFEPGRGYRLV
jgi:SIR2-like domain